MRHEIRAEVMRFLQSRNSHRQSSAAWQKKLVPMTRMIEEHLYRDAASTEEYADRDTLSSRLTRTIERVVKQSSARINERKRKYESFASMDEAADKDHPTHKLRLTTDHCAGTVFNDFNFNFNFNSNFNSSRSPLECHQVQLLALRHAYKCPCGAMACPDLPHCWEVKLLTAHMMKCNQKQCDQPHCMSSKVLLAHYHKCRMDTCALCQPVRNAKKSSTVLPKGYNQSIQFHHPTYEQIGFESGLSISPESHLETLAEAASLHAAVLTTASVPAADKQHGDTGVSAVGAACSMLKTADVKTPTLHTVATHPAAADAPTGIITSDRMAVSPINPFEFKRISCRKDDDAANAHAPHATATRAAGGDAYGSDGFIPMWSPKSVRCSFLREEDSPSSPHD